MSRFAKIAAKLDEYGLDALLVTSAPNRFYATGFPSSAGMAVITKEASYFFTDSRYIEAAGKTIRDGQVMESTGSRPMTALAGEVLERHHVKTLGFEEQYVTVASYESWRKTLKCELAPATALLSRLRDVKEPGELEKMIAAQRIAEKALQDTLDYIKAGRTEKEISAYLQYRILVHGADNKSFDPIVVSGANSSMPHGVPSDKPVEDGDFVTMDFGAKLAGYCSDMTRTVAVGHVTEEMDKVYHTVLEAQRKGIATARAGVPGAAIHAAAAKVIAGAGYGPYFGHGFGHGLGIEIHEGAGANPANTEPLPAGAVVSAEPGVYIPGRFGVRIEDVMVIGEEKSTSIMEAPKDLMIL